jgi:hypothetical protein
MLSRALFSTVLLLLLLALSSTGCTAQILQSIPDRKDSVYSAPEYSPGVESEQNSDVTPLHRPTRTGVDMSHFSGAHNTSALSTAFAAVSSLYMTVRSHPALLSIALRVALLFSVFIAAGRLIGTVVKCLKSGSVSSASASASSSSVHGAVHMANRSGAVMLRPPLSLTKNDGYDFT